LADWTGINDDDVNGFYGGGEKRSRGGRKKRKKDKEQQLTVQDWGDIYDPARPNIYEAYRHSDEQIREVREWKDRLYVHRIAKKSPSEKDSDEEDYRPQMGKQFAPPPNYSFAPPSMDSPPKPAVVPEDKSDSDQYNRPALPPPSENPPPPSIPVTLAAGSISRAPVRYNLPQPPSEIPSSEAELGKVLADEGEVEEEEDAAEAAPRSLRPGQKGFAERLMSKYGWSKGKGLGAEESGIVNPLRVQIEKRKKKSDAEGGGFRDPGGRGKIIGGRKNVPTKESEEDGKFGPMSEVIVLRGMVDGMDLDEEIGGSGDGGIMQEIGDECGEKVCLSFCKMIPSANK
jgi:splicing factor 45